MLLKLIPQRFTAVNQALTCPYDVWIYYSKCCVGLGEPLIPAPGDHLCFQSKDHLENGPGRLQCRWTQATVQTQTSADGPHSEDCLDEIIVSNVFQKCLIDHTNLSSITFYDFIQPKVTVKSAQVSEEGYQSNVIHNLIFLFIRKDHFKSELDFKTVFFIVK